MKNKWRSIAWVLVVALLCGQIPTQVYAKEGQSIQTVSGGDSAVENTGAGMDTISRANTTDVKDSEINWTEEKAEEMDAVYDALVVAANATDNITFAGGDGTEDNPYQVATPEQLDAVRTDMDACYVQIADIDLSGWNWEPIGNIIYDSIMEQEKKEVFEGKYNGNNFEICNLTINQDDSNNQTIGLFGLNNGVIENVTVEECNFEIDLKNIVEAEEAINARNIYIGGIVGKSFEGVIRNCSISGEIFIKNAYQAFIGGIVGLGECINSTNYADIRVVGINYGDRAGVIECGGIVGQPTRVNGKILNCVNYGKIIASADTFLYCGGISGEDGEIENCINYGDVSGEILAYKAYSSFALNGNVGGIVGATSADLSQSCINYGNISASKRCVGASVCAGGIVGFIGYYGEGNYIKSYNFGKYINSDDYAGRVAGIIDSKISNCFSSGVTLVNGTVPTENIGHDLRNGATICNDGNINSVIQTIIQYGKNSNSFDEEIIGYCGSTIETTLMLKSDKYTIDDLTILSSDNTVVEIGHIEKGMGTYVPADGSEYVAVVHLNLKDIGSSEIMISAPDGTFKSIPVTSKEAVYSIKMYSLIPTLTIGKKTSIGAAVQLDRNGTMVIDDVSFSIVSSNCNVVSISDIRSESDGTFFSLNGVSEGTAVITVTESVSGAVYSTTVYVNSGILTYNAEAMPKYYDGKNECNGYIDGMYIDEFISEPCEDSKLSVSFNVYNTTSKNGAVDVYDAKGKLVDSEMIERFSDNYVTSIKDTFISGYKLLEDCVNGDLLTYKQASCSQKTLVEVEVPVGGHIEITNNSTYSDTCAIYNEVDLSITSVLMLSDVIKLNVEEIKGVSKTATKKLVSGFFETYVDSLKGNTAAEKISELGKKFDQKIGEMGMKQMLESTIKGNMATIIDDGKVILEECDIDLDALILSSVADVGVSLVEDSLKEAMGIPGAVLSSMFKVNEYLNHTSFLIDMCATNGNKALMIYFDDENGCLYDDGVSVKSANGTNELSQDNYVMHSVVLSNNTDLSEQMKEALDKISTQYVVRDIYLLKDDIITQPDQDVQVTVPIPKEYDIYSCKLYWVQEDGSLTEIRTQIVNRNFIFTTNHFSYYAVVETKEMSSISGTVTCFGDGTASTTMRLVDSSGAITAENTIIGNSAEYALENIPLGTYTLQVSKQNHITREYVVTLSDAIVIVTQDTELHLVGDINGDGRINARDKKMLYNHIACLTVLDDYDLAVADVNGDGKVNARDKKIIYNHIAGISLLWE